MTNFNSSVPADFRNPIATPASADQALRWQEANRSWWQNNPMRYDWRDGIQQPEFSREFYEEIDQRFFSSVREYLPWHERPFDSLIDFEATRGMDVLEIGVGNGSHAQMIAERAKSFTGVDLTDCAVETTRKRTECFGIDADIRQMDAESLEFEDESFDLVWSWGVIHHSANTEQVLREIRRVLRPGGLATTMVYHRNFWNAHVVSGLLFGLIGGELFRGHSVHRIQQRRTDGAIARFYSVQEWSDLVSQYLTLDRVEICGQKSELFPLPAGRLKSGCMAVVPSLITRFLTNQCRLGTFLVSQARRPV